MSSYSVTVHNTNNETVAQLDLEEKVFGCEVKPHLFYEAVKMQLANRRNGTACAKNRVDVRWQKTVEAKRYRAGAGRFD